MDNLNFKEWLELNEALPPYRTPVRRHYWPTANFNEPPKTLGGFARQIGADIAANTAATIGDTVGSSLGKLRPMNWIRGNMPWVKDEGNSILVQMQEPIQGPNDIKNNYYQVRERIKQKMYRYLTKQGMIDNLDVRRQKVERAQPTKDGKIFFMAIRFPEVNSDYFNI